MMWCKCWRNKWQYDMMTDDRGVCKHCGQVVQWFLVRDSQ